MASTAAASAQNSKMAPSAAGSKQDSKTQNFPDRSGRKESTTEIKISTVSDPRSPISDSKASPSLDDEEKQRASTDKEEDKPRYLRFVFAYILTQHLLTAMLSTIIIAIMALTITRYNSTNSVPGAWPVDALLTPTFVMLAMAVLTATADIIVLFVQCCSERTAACATTAAGRVRTLRSVLQTMASASGAGYFKWVNMNSGGKDLWGWTCSDAGDKLGSVNSSGTVCSANNSAFAISILQVSVQSLSVIIPILAMWNPNAKKGEKRLAIEAGLKKYEKGKEAIDAAEADDGVELGEVDG